MIKCGECVRHDNCWLYDEHKDDNGTCVWAESKSITESANDVVEKNDEVIERPIIEHDREWIIGCIEHDGFIHTHRFDKANQIIHDALSAEAVQGEWLKKQIFNPELDKYIPFIECSVCGYAPYYGGSESKFNFCANCGAKMTKGGDSE